MGVARGHSALRSVPALALLAVMLQVAPRPAAAAFEVPLPIPPVKTGTDITIHAVQAQVPILSTTQPTTMWTFDGTFPGPTIKVQSGAEARVTFVNDLPTEAGAITIHRHGGHNACEHDGQPMDGHKCRADAPSSNYLIPRGGQRTYTYGLKENGEAERGALEWYHDHTMDNTSRNVWMGLAGMFIVEDGVDRALKLPVDEYDVPLMIADRSFDENNQLSFTFDSNGTFGDTTLVNGAPTPYFEVADRKYRFRILNASNDRSYELALSNDQPMIQVGTESGLMPFPVARTSIPIGPAERVEVVIDFAGKLGQDIVLKHARGFGNMQNVMQFRVTQDATEDPSVVPPTLRPLPETVDLLKHPPTNARTWVLGQELGTQPALWTINGRAFDHERVDTAPLNPVLGSTELWTFVNSTGIDHLVHIHDVDWRLVARFGPETSQSDLALDPVCPSTLETPAGESCALKETFRVGPNETIVVAATFTDNLGRYMFHCHLLAHEDRAMMAQFEVVGASGSAPAHLHNG